MSTLFYIENSLPRFERTVDSFLRWIPEDIFNANGENRWRSLYSLLTTVPHFSAADLFLSTRKVFCHPIQMCLCCTPALSASTCGVVGAPSSGTNFTVVETEVEFGKV